MSALTAATLANPAFRDAMNQLLDGGLIANYPKIRDLLRAPPKFRKSREVSARRAAKLRKRGEYCHFVRWTVNGKCRYEWGGPCSSTFTRRLGPWQNSKWTPPHIDTIYTIETRYGISS